MQQVEKKQRIQWLDIVKGICMFFIFMAHSGFVPDYLNFFYNSFFLVAYFVLSGYLFQNPQAEVDFPKKFLRIIESILVPYLVYWAISNSVAAILKGQYNFLPDLLADMAYGNKLWFMSCLIVSEIVFLSVLALSRKLVTIVLFIVVSLVIWYFLKDYKLPWSFGLSFMASVFLSLGYILRIYSTQFLKYLGNDKAGIAILFIWAILLVIRSTVFNYRISFPANCFGNLLFYFPYVIFGSLGVFYLATKWTKFNYIAIFLGQNSLLYYFFQNQVLVVLRKIFAKLGYTEPNYWICILTAIVVTVVLIIPINLVLKYFPLLAGKSTFLSSKLKR